MSNEPTTILADYVLANLDREPVARRIKLTRALAALSPTSAERRELLAIADALRAVERRQRLLRLDFKRRAL